MQDHEPTNGDILEAINDFATNVEERFSRLEGEVGSLKQDVGSLKQGMVTKEVLAQEFSRFETRMVSKNYLDIKLIDQEDRLIKLVRKELSQAG